jgi:hypothetical protein
MGNQPAKEIKPTTLYESEPEPIFIPGLYECIIDINGNKNLRSLKSDKFKEELAAYLRYDQLYTRQDGGLVMVPDISMSDISIGLKKIGVTLRVLVTGTRITKNHFLILISDFINLGCFAGDGLSKLIGNCDANLVAIAALVTEKDNTLNILKSKNVLEFK